MRSLRTDFSPAAYAKVRLGRKISPRLGLIPNFKDIPIIMARFDFKAIGTSWRIDIPRDFSIAEETAILGRVMKRIAIFDKDYSRFREDSLVTKMSQEAGEYVLPDDALPMMKLYRDLYLRTGGLVTPLIGNLISDAGYDAQYSLVQKKPLEAAPKWDDILEYDHPRLLVKKPVILDFGAAGKGYLIDIVGGILAECGVMEYSINAGGDIPHEGGKAIRIGLENPDNTEQVIGVCSLASGSICGSAGTRRKWGTFTHIINPKTLESPRDIIAVWTTAKTALIADGLATCLFFVPPRSLPDAYEFEYVVLRAGGIAEKSEHFPGELFAA